MSTGAHPVAAWLEWLRDVWSRPEVTDAIGQASPVLAARIRVLCACEPPQAKAVRSAALSVTRYLVRMTGRPTPTGLFAGIAPATFGHRAEVGWGAQHQAVARADAGWLAALIGQIEGNPELLSRLNVVANSTMSVRGERLVLPYEPSGTGRSLKPVEVSLRHTPVVRAALAGARTPIRLADLDRKLRADFPLAPPAKITVLLTELVTQGALVTGLHAPSTELDALGHLLKVLDDAEVPMEGLDTVHTLLDQQRHTTPAVARTLRADAAERMNQLTRAPRFPIAVDLRLDAHVVLPNAVADEAARAATLLARLSSAPYGSDAWGDYHQRFYERYGTGALVPVLDVVADSGIGWPDDYPGSSAPRAPRTRRDELLLTLAQRAALDGDDEVLLEAPLIAELERADAAPPRLPANLELCVRVQAPDPAALDRGDFRLTIVSVSRGAGVITGRFLGLLDPRDYGPLTAHLAQLADDQTVQAQLSFPPLDPATAHVARAPRILPTVVSLAEHRDVSDANVLTVADLAVGCDSHRLYLAVPKWGKRIEVWGLHALNPRTHTPPLARLLSEITRAQSARVTTFDWGAASALPFLPRVRSGRVVLAPAQWRLTDAELPAGSAQWIDWDADLALWQSRRRLPRHVFLIDGDWRLPLDLAEPGHRVLLREHLRGKHSAVLEEAPAEDTAGWCDGRAHELVVPLSAVPAPDWPPLPAPAPQRIVGRDHSESPGTSPVLLAMLPGDARRQDTVLTRHLPELLADWEEEPSPWWFLRSRTGREDHLRLRIVLPDPGPESFGQAAARVSAWADELRRHGLLRGVSYVPSSPEAGRWGDGAALDAARVFFAADSRAVLTQLTQGPGHDRRALTVANFVSLAVAFTGSPDAGMRWFADHVPAAPPLAVPRSRFAEAVRLADPRDGFAALRAARSGDPIVDSWPNRDRAVTAYRRHLPGPHTVGVDADAVLGSLLHTHFLRAVGPDPDEKAACLYLARAAALAYAARTGAGQ